jgi:hypothetical protein
MVNDLSEAGYIRKLREGRRNRYKVSRTHAPGGSGPYASHRRGVADTDSNAQGLSVGQRYAINCTPPARGVVGCSYDFDFLLLFFFLPMLGNRFFTAARTFFCSAGVPFWATRASALRACALSGIGYLRFPGNANNFLLSFFRSLVLRSLAIFVAFPSHVAGNQIAGSPEMDASLGLTLEAWV